MFQLCLCDYVLIYLCIYSPVCSVWFRLVYSLLPGVSVSLPCFVLPWCLHKDYYLSLRPRLRVLVPPCCVHCDSISASIIISFSQILTKFNDRMKTLSSGELIIKDNLFVQLRKEFEKWSDYLNHTKPDCQYIFKYFQVWIHCCCTWFC